MNSNMKFKKIIVILLTIMMIFSTLPVQAAPAPTPFNPLPEGNTVLLQVYVGPNTPANTTPIQEILINGAGFPELTAVQINALALLGNVDLAVALQGLTTVPIGGLITAIVSSQVYNNGQILLYAIDESQGEYGVKIYLKQSYIVDYTVNYMDDGMPIAPPKTGSGYIGQLITESAISVPGYALNDTSPKSITLLEAPANNVITFEYDLITYTVLWYNGMTLLETDSNVLPGSQPDYNGLISPTYKTAQYTYTFQGWNADPNATTGVADTALPTVTGDVTYYAIYSRVTNEYTVTWKNGTTTLETDLNVPYGTQPDFNGLISPGYKTAQYTVTFVGWNTNPNATTGVADTALPTVTGDVTYYAIYSRVTNEYTVTWKNGTTTLETDLNVPYGTQPDYNGLLAGTYKTAQYTFTFVGWNTNPNATTGVADTALPTVTGDVTYYAIYSRVTNEYTVTWKNGTTTLETDLNVPYGTQPDYNGLLAGTYKTAQYTFTFVGWNTNPNATTGVADTALPTVTGDVTYYAIYSRVTNEYTVTWKNGTTTLETDLNVPYGTQPDYNGLLAGTYKTAQYTFTFVGWNTDPNATTGVADTALPTVTGDVTYYAIYSSVVNTYTVTWENYDGTLLEQDLDVPYGTLPSYNGAVPTRPADAQYTYTFLKWNPTPSPVTGNVTYSAGYLAVTNTYTVIWNDYDGSLLELDKYVPYGATPSFDGVTPTRAADAQYTYTFNGWSPSISMVIGSITYTATYTETTNEYTVTWNDEDGTQLEKDLNVPYGIMPSYDGSTPTKAATAQYTFTFNGWTPAVSAVTGDVTYTATYTETTNEYIVTWENYDGTQLEQDLNVPYGATPSFDGTTPIRAADAQYTYTFNGWSPTVSIVTGDVTYTAQYSTTTNNYTVTWLNYNGAQMEKDLKVPYGTMPSYNGTTPTRTTTATYRYAFSGWTPTVKSVTGNITYTATFTAIPITYTVTFVDDDGTILDIDTVAAGGDAVPPADPIKEGHSFAGWDGDYTNVTSNRTITATYDLVGYQYTVRYVDTEGTELADPKVESADFGTEVTETAIDIEGYEPQEIEQTLVIGTEGNEIVFIYDAVEVPLAGPTWALINLLLMILTVLIGGGLLIGYFRKKDEDENVKRKGGLRISSIVPAIIAIIVFFLTEDMTNPMAYVDNWTIVMGIIAAVEVVVMILATRRSEQKVNPA